MSANQQKLANMLSAAPGQSAAVASSISSVEDAISDLTDEAAAMEGALTDVAEADLVTYLEDTKLQEITGDSTSPTRVDYGANFGTINYTTGGITDWAIQEFQGITWTDIYVYEGVGWDGDTTITGLIDDYAFGNDYLTRPLTSGATYGIYPNITSLGIAQSILEQNKSIIDQSINVLPNYV